MFWLAVNGVLLLLAGALYWRARYSSASNTTANWLFLALLLAGFNLLYLLTN